MAMPGVTLEDLRAELKNFAESAVRQELEALKDSLLDELRETKDAQIIPPKAKKEDCKSTSVKPSDTEAAARAPAKLLEEGLHQAMQMALSPGEDGDGKQPKKMTVKSSRKSLRPVTVVPKINGNGFTSGNDGFFGAIRDLALECILSHTFENLTIVAVLLNAAWIGFQTDYVARTWTEDPPFWFRSIDGAFCAASLVEVIIRMTAAGSAFFYGPGWKWNWFDFLVAASQTIDMSIQIINKGGHSNLQGLRLIKLVRIMRIARIATVFPELHVLITSVMDSLHSLFWTLLLVISVLYAMAIVITQMVAEHKISVGIDEMQENQMAIIKNFGTLDATIISLYMVISEGTHWSELMDPLVVYVNPMFKYIFVVFVGFQLFAMMNVITACFVDNAMKIAAKAESDEVLESLSSVIGASNGLNDYGYKLLTAEAFQEHAQESGMLRFMDLIGASGEDPASVFAVIDSRGDGVLSNEEFLRQCEKIIGPAKAMSMYRMEHELKEGLRSQGHDMTRIFEAQQLQHKMVLDMFSKVLERTGQMQQQLTAKVTSAPQGTPPGSPRDYQVELMK